ncbi:MAG TPA: UDP-N-acetylmuramoyl-tripeptide--D-alanyl-D-alanine ligase [Rectinema sp.]|nr:UDP-N-acetylmuramoyl-tripeptide--D-alanyl-D-alanine ligase [Rectinema sp.]HQQ72368.1 UDP-N-acetylmuramoyl-tripeptide--D-alanyl-D-alanine ligase [Rectinema sp.]
MENNSLASDQQVLFYAGELAGIIGATCKGKLDTPICSVVTDSRLAEPNSMFVALKGERTDGHHHILEAIQNGARAILAEQEEKDIAIASIRNSGLVAEICLILADSPLSGLQYAAREYRRRHNLFRIGVTGSSGKTTTKECIASMLSACFPEESIAVSPGNLNSDIGLALAIFGIKPQHKIGIFEMGINRKGEMDELAKMYEPDIAVITNIGSAHVGIFGSRDEIAREKSKIFSYFNGQQKALLWEDDDYKVYLSSKVKGTVHYFGLRSTEGLGRIENKGLDGWRIEWKGLTLDFALPGKHNLLNACASLSMAILLDLDPILAVQGLSKVQPLFGRSQLCKGKITVFQDYYNANPDSMAAAIDFLSGVSSTNRKVLILGSMLELGKESDKAHRDVGFMVAGMNPEAVFLFGEEMKAAEAVLKEADFKGMLMYTTEMENLIDAVSNYIKEGDLVLIKGSRGMALERLSCVFEEKGLINLSDSSKGGHYAP